MSLRGGSFQADVSPDVVAGVPLIKGYGDDYFILANKQHSGAIMLHQSKVISHKNIIKMDDLLKLFLADVLHDHAPDIFIFGTGKCMFFPPDVMRDAFAQAGIGFEFMDSRAAARTYNIIVSEGRTVSAFLFLPGTLVKHE
ncbi:MAG: Mth938-like domain-containing protein [Mariprofundaceae bacterium]|nr:Mth938-like domain-containing protein [Mariprofundaceae bacterium]